MPDRRNLKDHLIHPAFSQIGKISDQEGTETRYEINGGVIEVKANTIILLTESVK